MTNLGIDPLAVGDGVLRLAVASEVDMSNSELMVVMIDDAVTARHLTELVVDLDRVTFLDSSGVAALVNGTTFNVVRRVLDVSRADRRSGLHAFTHSRTEDPTPVDTLPSTVDTRSCPASPASSRHAGSSSRPGTPLRAVPMGRLVIPWSPVPGRTDRPSNEVRCCPIELRGRPHGLFQAQDGPTVHLVGTPPSLKSVADSSRNRATPYSSTSATVMRSMPGAPLLGAPRATPATGRLSVT